MTADTAIKAVKELGLPTVIALGLGLLLWQSMERYDALVARWETLMQYVMDPAGCQPKAPPPTR